MGVGILMYITFVTEGLESFRGCGYLIEKSVIEKKRANHDLDIFVRGVVRFLKSESAKV